jgi:uroporphyrin-III C-methyltransferase
MIMQGILVMSDEQTSITDLQLEAKQTASNAQQNSSTKQSMWQGKLALLLSSVCVVALLGLGYKLVLEAQDQQTLAQQLQQQQVNWQQLQQQLDIQGQQLADSQVQLQQAVHFLGRNQTDWLLITVAQKLKMANLVLYFTRHAVGMTQVLLQLDRQIEQTHDVSLYPLRESLAKDIAALRAVQVVDLPGLLSELTALQAQVEKLPIKKLQHRKNQVEAPMKELLSQNWHTVLQQSWDKLKTIMLIRRHDEKIRPVLSMRQQHYIVQNIYLLLQQAKWAAISEQPQLYSDSIQQAIILLNRHFMHTTVALDPIVLALQRLAQMTVKPKLPRLLYAEQAVKNIMQARMNSASVANKQEGM